MKLKQITEKQIKFTKTNEDNEPDVINEIRDLMQVRFYEEIKGGKTLYFKNWNYSTGTINYQLA